MYQRQENAAEAEGVDRREFLAQAGLAGASVLAGASAWSAPIDVSDTAPDRIPKKPFGKTSDKVSIIGIGGYTLGQAPSYEEAERIVHEAIDAGVTFFDNAWDYHQGKSEEWVGKALNGKRDKVLLMTKVCTHGRDKKVAMQQLEESLKRLQTDHLDLWQVHEVIY